VSLIYVSQPGMATVVSDPGASPVPFAMTGWGGAMAFKAVVTDVQGGHREALQATPAFRRRLFVDSFGREPGRLRVAGVAFAGGCSDDATHGLEYVRDFYDAHCASARAEPVTVLLGTTGAARDVGFLVGLDTAVDRADLRLGSFALTLATLPRRFE